MKYKYLLIICLLYSCTKEVIIDLPPIENKLVLNCLFNSDSTIKAQLSKIQEVNQTSQLTIDNAYIKLYENNLLCDILKFDKNGWYVSNIKPIENNTYSIIAKCENFPDISSSDAQPSKIIIINTSHIDTAGFDSQNKPYSSIILKFKDPQEYVNYYEISLIVLVPDTIFPCFGSLPMFSDDIVLNSEGINNYNTNVFPFTDKLLNGKEYSMKINYYAPIFMYNNYKIVVLLKSVTETYYKYRLQLIKYNSSNTNNIWNGNYINMFSNINNGYGIFAGFALDTDTIKIN